MGAIEQILGIFTFICFSCALIPQLVLIIKRKTSEGTAKLWPTVGLLACTSGTAYITISTGGNPPFWVLTDYIVGICLNSLILILAIYYCPKRKNDKRQQFKKAYREPKRKQEFSGDAIGGSKPAYFPIAERTGDMEPVNPLDVRNADHYGR